MEGNTQVQTLMAAGLHIELNYEGPSVINLLVGGSSNAMNFLLSIYNPLQGGV